MVRFAYVFQAYHSLLGLFGQVNPYRRYSWRGSASVLSPAARYQAQFRSQQHAERISRNVREVEAADSFNLLAGPELLEMTDSLLPEHRERLCPPALALSMFMKQVLSEDGSCQRAVDSWAAQRAGEGQRVQSINTAPTAMRRWVRLLVSRRSWSCVKR
jgi:hypothetical protein